MWTCILNGRIEVDDGSHILAETACYRKFSGFVKRVYSWRRRKKEVNIQSNRLRQMQRERERGHKKKKKKNELLQPQWCDVSAQFFPLMLVYWFLSQQPWCLYIVSLSSDFFLLLIFLDGILFDVIIHRTLSYWTCTRNRIYFSCCCGTVVERRWCAGMNLLSLNNNNNKKTTAANLNSCSRSRRQQKMTTSIFICYIVKLNFLWLSCSFYETKMVCSELSI